jgi:hypothetical protein
MRAFAVEAEDALELVATRAAGEEWLRLGSAASAVLGDGGRRGHALRLSRARRRS